MSSKYLIILVTIKSVPSEQSNVMLYQILRTFFVIFDKLKGGPLKQSYMQVYELYKYVYTAVKIPISF